MRYNGITSAEDNMGRRVRTGSSYILQLAKSDTLRSLLQNGPVQEFVGVPDSQRDNE